MERTGFIQGYMYLEAGNYTLVEVADKEIVTTIGGEKTDVTEVNNEECDESGYALVAATEDGASFAVSTAGLYVVAYDNTLSEIVYDQIETAGIIGGATPGGWSDDTKMTGSVTAEGGTWTVEGVALEQNQMKFRFNCRWAIDRRLDTTQDFDNENGYSFFTNFGGDFDNLLPGNEGANMEIAERGEYTVTLSWTPSGFTASHERTGDLEPLPEYPAEMWMIGSGLELADTDEDGTPDGWQWALEGVQMNPTHSNPHVFWSIVWLQEGGEIKFAETNDWGTDFGKTGEPTDGVWEIGSDNVPVPGAGYYTVVVNVESNTVEINAPMVYGIGDAFGNDDSQWDAANPNQIFTVDNENEVISYEGLVSTSDVRIHVAASTLTVKDGSGPVDWWQAEFIVLDGMIEYRGTGDDQARAQGTEGGSVTLNFKDGTGTID